MQKWIVTGISGSGRIELLEELQYHCIQVLHKKVIVHDIGQLIRSEYERAVAKIIDEKVLDIDRQLQSVLRSSAVKDVLLSISRNSDADLHLIGLHACFRWRNRLIAGLSFADLLQLEPDGFINIHRNVEEILRTNKNNPKWDEDSLPDGEKTQEWMMEEEFVTEVLASVRSKPMYVVARDHHVANLADLFFTTKKKIYLSYPISEIRNENPELLTQVQGPILNKLEEYFVVFNPLSIGDMKLTYPGVMEKIPELVDQLNANAKDIIKKRTIERDFQFIDQTDAVAVFYLTNKVSPGVLAEVYYAHRNMKHVFMVFSGRRSPFIEDAVDNLENDIDSLLPYLLEFANKK